MSSWHRSPPYLQVTPTTTRTMEQIQHENGFLNGIIRFSLNNRLAVLVIAFICLVAGLIISYLYAAPTGASIVLCNLAAFFLFTAAQKRRERLQSTEKSL